MSLKLIVEKLMRRNGKFILSSELKSDCKKLGLDYYVVIRYLIRNKYLVTIFRGIFYVYSIEERKFGKSEMVFYDILKEALRIKGVKNWYFGLETALKFNNFTHEYFNVDYVVSDSLYRAKPMNIMGHKVKFYKLSHKLVSFGIIANKLNYSDSEKTVLDLLYLKHYSIPEFKEVSERLSKAKLVKYSKYYPKSIQEAL